MESEDDESTEGAGRGRVSYFDHENRAMCEFLLSELDRGNRAARNPCGNLFWRYAIKKNDVFASRSYQSLRDHMRRVILPNLHKVDFGLDPNSVERLSALFHLDVARPKNWRRTPKHTKVLQRAPKRWTKRRWALPRKASQMVEFQFKPELSDKEDSEDDEKLIDIFFEEAQKAVASSSDDLPFPVAKKVKRPRRQRKPRTWRPNTSRDVSFDFLANLEAKHEEFLKTINVKDIETTWGCDWSVHEPKIEENTTENGENWIKIEETVENVARIRPRLNGLVHSIEQQKLPISDELPQNSDKQTSAKFTRLRRTKVEKAMQDKQEAGPSDKQVKPGSSDKQANAVTSDKQVKARTADKQVKPGRCDKQVKPGRSDKQVKVESGDEKPKAEENVGLDKQAAKSSLRTSGRIRIPSKRAISPIYFEPKRTKMVVVPQETLKEIPKNKRRRFRKDALANVPTICVKQSKVSKRDLLQDVAALRRQLPPKNVVRKKPANQQPADAAAAFNYFAILYDERGNLVDRMGKLIRRLESLDGATLKERKARRVPFFLSFSTNGDSQTSPYSTTVAKLIDEVKLIDENSQRICVVVEMLEQETMLPINAELLDAQVGYS